VSVVQQLEGAGIAGPDEAHELLVGKRADVVHSDHLPVIRARQRGGSLDEQRESIICATKPAPR
jgi:hypothetical protein